MARYDLDVLVIGGGAAGLTTSGIAANFGAKTMMVERDKLGGDCTWTGCIPSKTLIKTAKVIHEMRKAESHGLISQNLEIDFDKIIQHVDEVRNEVYEDADKPEIFEEMGIDVVKGEARFLDPHKVEITDGNGIKRAVTSRYIFICTGSSAYIPPIPGIEDVEFLTNDSLFEVDNLPESLTIVGAGPIGCEMAQSFARLGSEVTVVDMAPRIMVNDDDELAGLLQKELEKEGVRFILNANIKGTDQTGDGVRIQIERGDEELEQHSKELLMATGRRPNVSDLNTGEAGIHFSDKGIEVDDKCRTNVRHIYAAGDVTGRYQFTHMSEHMAKVAVTNALLKVPMKIDKKHVPWSTFTDPELAHVGATKAQLDEKGVSYEVYKFPFSKIDRAITDGNRAGWIKVYAKKWNGRILGADVLGAHAGEMISQYALAMRNGITLRQFADTIHPYPSYGLGARRAADQWYIKNQSEGMVKWLKRIFRYKGEVPDYSDPDRIV